MTLLWLVPVFPAVGFALLALFGARWPGRVPGLVGAGSVGLSLLCTAAAGLPLAGRPGAEARQVLFTWVEAGGLEVTFGYRLDALSLVMISVVTLVGFLIHLYAVESMVEEDGYSRFFAYLNLFVAFMLVLVLADNLFLLLLGWEGVGLCSYLLIGFRYRDRANGLAAQKAFIVTRVGDLALVAALMVLFAAFGTLDTREVAARATASWAPGSGPALAVALLLLAGAAGKSAQAPLQVWLPDAMAGPTPVSALIHAATMVTAGVYLIARMHPLLALAPAAMAAVAVVGAATALYAATCALAQRDLKRALAYSTMSQVGYMFVALGVGAWPAAIFHLFTHAFFKALLFLGAGVVIDALHHEHDLFQMGGLRRRLPLTFWTFAAGAASLAALPLVTAGFFSKDTILWSAWASPLGGAALWGVAALTAVLTALYTGRVTVLAFLGEAARPGHELHRLPGPMMKGVLLVLAFFSVTAGSLWLPDLLGGFDPFGRFLAPVLPAVAPDPARAGHGTELALLVTSALASLVGLWLGWLYARRERRWEGAPLPRFLREGWWVDRLYRAALARPFTAGARLNARDAIDRGFAALSRAVAELGRRAALTETGRVRSYAAGLVAGALLCAALILYL